MWMHASVSAPTGLECLTREWMVWRHTQLQHKGLLVLLCHPHPRPHPLLPPLPHLTDCHRHRLAPQSRSQTSSQSCGSCRKMLPPLCGGKHVSCCGVSAVCIWALQISTYFPQAQAGAAMPQMPGMESHAARLLAFLTPLGIFAHQAHNAQVMRCTQTRDYHFGSERHGPDTHRAAAGSTGCALSRTHTDRLILL